MSGGLCGLSLIRGPAHAALYLGMRVGSGVADTATATLVAKSSRDKDDRARNLGLIQSTRAATRIFSPIVSGSLFASSCAAAWAPGALPYLTLATCALAAAPLPLLLRAAQRRAEEGQEADR